MPIISVIIPVFNAEAYLHSCVDSVLAQTFTDFELILVDDGSKDTSGKICDEYSHKDARVRVIHQKNSGISAARNTGINQAKGAFVFFMDNDDVIPGSCLKELCILQEKENPDIIIGKRKSFRSILNITNEPDGNREYKMMSGGEFFNYKTERRFVTGHLYRTELAKAILFDTDTVLGEDTIFNYSILLENPNARILNCDLVTYYWRIREDSTFHSEGGDVAFYSVGKWCVNTFQRVKDNADSHPLKGSLLLEALKELLLFRELRKTGNQLDCRELLNRGLIYLLNEPHITAKDKICYFILTRFPSSYSAMRWLLEKK